MTKPSWAGSDLCLVTKIWFHGTAWFAAELVRGLAEMGAHVTFIAPAIEPAFREPKHPNVRRMLVPRELTEYDTQLSSYKSKLRRIANTAAAIFCKAASARTFIFSIPDHEIITIPIFLLLRLIGREILLVVHDPLPHDLQFASKGRRRIKSGLLRTQYTLASRLVVFSEPGKKELIIHFGLSEPKINVIPIGAFEFPAQSPIPGQRILLAFGQLRRNKNVLEAINAVKMLRRAGLAVQLMLASGADRSDPYCRACLDAIAEDPEGFIVDFGFIDDADIPRIIERVDAFILAYSDFSSQSAVAVMAGLSGRPVISSFAGGIQELRKAGLAGVDVGQPISAATIAAAIKRYYEIPLEEWQRAAEAGRVSLSRHLDWRRIAQMYLSLCERGVKLSQLRSYAVRSEQFFTEKAGR
ncbi:MAG: glycosyltransferase family 4 protein [Acetobacteraceae bacterium]|nr:glycosyltransferase family 4 protein [Acetobacteraceae bacterium]